MAGKRAVPFAAIAAIAEAAAAARIVGDLKHKFGVICAQPIKEFVQDGFRWLPLVNEDNGLVCGVDILMLRDGCPGRAVQDLDNRLKTIFDALRMAKSPDELGRNTSRPQTSAETENPFLVVLQDDKLITHVLVTTDNLLEPVVGVSQADGVRLVLNVTIRPYHVHMENLAFT